MSESMKPAINLGDMLVTGPPGGPLSAETKPGVITTYGHGKEMVTHRVLSVDGNTLVTKGDAAEDPYPRPIALSDIRGIYLFKIPYIGYLSSFMRTRAGWFSLIIAPTVVLVAFIIKDIIKEALRCD